MPVKLSNPFIISKMHVLFFSILREGRFYFIPWNYLPRNLLRVNPHEHFTPFIIPLERGSMRAFKL